MHFRDVNATLPASDRPVMEFAFSSADFPMLDPRRDAIIRANLRGDNLISEF